MPVAGQHFRTLKRRCCTKTRAAAVTPTPDGLRPHGHSHRASELAEAVEQSHTDVQFRHLTLKRPGHHLLAQPLEAIHLRLHQAAPVVDLPVGMPHTLDVGHKDFITLGSRAAQLRVTLPGCVAPVTGPSAAPGRWARPRSRHGGGRCSSSRLQSAVELRLRKKRAGRLQTRYQNRSIESSQVMEELVEMAKKFREASRRGEVLGLSEDEVKFYEALIENESAARELSDEILKKIAQELTDNLRKNVTVDWAERESVRARLRLMVKRVLKKYKYPPDSAESAVEMVLEQAKALGESWV